MKYIKLWIKYIEIGLINAMEYRINFLLGGLFETCWVIMNLVYFNTIFSFTDSIGGWTKNQALFLVFYCALIDNLFGFNFWGGITQIPELIRTGTLDHLLIKPINLRFQLSVKYINCSQIYNLIFDICGLCYFANKLNTFVTTPYKILLFVFLGINSVFIIYNFYFIIFTICFWVIEASMLRKFSQDVFTVGNKPINIYPIIIQKIFTYVIPIAVAFSFSAEILINDFSLLQLGKVFLISIVFFIFSHLFFKFSIRKYSSASS